MPSSLDKLGAGALLALAEADIGFPRLLTKFGWVALWAIVAEEILLINRRLEWVYLLRTELLIVTFAALVAAASSGISGPAGAILNCKPVRYVGRISYGIYLFHLFIYGLIEGALARVGLPPLERGPTTFVLLSAISIAVAAVSWHFFELPLNRFKERFVGLPISSQHSPIAT
jgi:peptidoglycan/LPS O-acetylase OafA/YrhL